MILMSVNLNKTRTGTTMRKTFPPQSNKKMRLFSLILFMAGMAATTALHAQNVTINSQANVAGAVATINANSGVINNLTINETAGAITDLSPLSAILLTVTGNLTIQNIGDLSAGTSISWAALTNINGNLTIGGAATAGNTQLSSVSFPGLSTVDGSVLIQNNAGLSSVSFAALSMVDASVDIRSNSGLTTVSLPSLFTINDEFIFWDNDNISSLSMGALLDANSVQIQQNGALQTISLPLINSITTNLVIQGTSGNTQPNLQTVTIGNSLDIGGNLTISNNASTNLTALNLGNVEMVGGAVTLDNDNLAASVAVNLSGLTSVGGAFTVRETAQNLNINSLATVSGNFLIQSNTNLNNITATAFTNTTFGGNLTLINNTSLSDCCIFSCDVLSGVAGTINISGNASGCSSVANIAQTCMDAFTGNLTITSKSQIDNFCYSIINGDLTIDGTGIGDAALILNLYGMTSLTQITGNLTISNLPSLTSLGGTTNGLSNLASIGGDFTLNNLELLANVGNGTTNGLKSLATIGGSLEVSDNDELANLNGLSNLASLSGSLNILSNPDLIDVDGISSAVPGAMGIMDFVLDNNPLLASLGTLELVINGDLRVIDNGQLDDLGLLNFIAGGTNDLEFINNDDLLSFSSLTITGSVVNNLSVSNSDLNDASALAAITTINGVFLFEDNDQVSGIPGANFNVMGGIEVIGNALVTTLDWFGSTTTLSGDLIIRDNFQLGDLPSFSSLTSVGGDFEINDADQLTDLDDFSALMSVSGDVTVTDNNLLASCCVVPCKLSMASSITVSGNTGDCLDLAAAQSACNITGINIDAIPQVCAGEQATVTVTGLATAPATYTLEYEIDGVAQTAVTGLTAAANTFLTRVLNNADNGVNLVVTSVTRTDQAIDCSQTTGFTTRVLDVKPIPTINAIADMSYCEGESVSILLSDVTSSASTDYSWSGGADVGISDGSDTGSGIAEITGTASGSPLPITRTISVDATLNGCVAPTETFDVTVNPIPDISTYAPGGPAGAEDVSLEAVVIPGLTPPNDQGWHICSGEAFDVEVTTTRNNIRLKWEVISIGNSGVSGYTVGDMGSHFFATAGAHSFTGSGANLTLTDIIRRNVAFELTPIYDPDGIDNNGDECIGTPIEYRIRVWPQTEASFSNTGASVLCSGTDITGQLEISQTTAFSESDPSADGSIVYDVVIALNPDITELVGGVNLNDVGNGATDGDPSVDPVADLGIPATLTNTSGSAQTVTIEVTPRFLSADPNAPECSGATQMITLTVEPQPDLAVSIIAPAPGAVIDGNNPSYSATVCSGAAFEATSSTSVTAPSGANQLWVKIELDDPTGALGFGSGMQTINVPQSLLTFPNTALLNTSGRRQKIID